MRLRILLSVLATTLLVSSVAAAQGTPFGNGTNGKSGSGSSGDDDDDEEADKAPQPYYQRKSWSVGTSFETNRTILQEDVGVRGKAFNTLSLYASYNVTKAD
jgi:hypothetical protein